MAQGKTGKVRSGGPPQQLAVQKSARAAERRPLTSGRESVASARQSSPESNRTQMIIGIVAIVLIAIVIVVGLVLNKQGTAAPVTDHPRSTNSTASVDSGVVTVTVTGGRSTPTIDLFEDGICPKCQDFEAQYGQQVMKAVDEGKLTVRYHFLNFLNANSPSKDYSTRAGAAFQCVAAVPPASAPKGLFLNFHTMMFAAGTQPAEGGGSDLSNEQIAQIASKAGAPASAAACITSGAQIPASKAGADAAKAVLAKAVGGDGWGTPTAMKDGALLGINDTDWLTKLLG